MRRLQIVLVALGALLVASAATAQEPVRLALLIGNQTYTGKIQSLKNPHNDIKTVGKALQVVGFKVTPLQDAGRRQMLSAVKTFAAELAKGGPSAVGFLYYSGHGVARPEDRGNYLIPIDLKDTSSTDFWFDAVKLDDILGELERAAPFAAHFVVFDACRDELKLPYKSAAKGFEPVAERSGMFIAFTTALGAVALDEAKAGGASGPYSAALASELLKPGQDHLQLFQNVKEGVFAATSRQQVPWERNGLLRRVYFGGTALLKVAPSGLGQAAAEWDALRTKTDIAELQDFAARHRGTYFADLAQARVADLKKLVANSDSENVPARAWEKIKDTNDIAVIEAFIRKYWDTYYAQMARNRIEELKKLTTQSGAEPAWEAVKDSTDVAALEGFIRRYWNTYHAQMARNRIELLQKAKRR